MPPAARVDNADGRPSFLAIDLGASSGRAVVGTLDGDSMSMHEVHRFPTPLVEADGHLYWDIDALWLDIRDALMKALAMAPSLRSVSVDSWGVDYVPLDRNGEPVRRPYSYRDPRTRGRLADATTRLGGADALYQRTGVQFLDLNTLPQVVSDLADEPHVVERTTMRLTVAEYFLFRLCGMAVAERTMASTTQLLDIRSGNWAADVIHGIGDDVGRWPRIVPPGTRLREVGAEILPGAKHRPLVIATCAHDTAAAVAAVPASTDTRWAYISSGTWSLVGVELHAPNLTRAAREAGFTNEVGLDDTIRFLKNCTGMWVLEECAREWRERGQDVARTSLARAAMGAGRAEGTIDLNAPEFAERGRMLEKITRACRERGIRMPTRRGAIARLVFESLVESYAETLDALETLTGETLEVVHVVGGGANNHVMNDLIAARCGRPVIAGPAEATTLGNLLVQARTLGELPAASSIRDVARRSTTTQRYEPYIPRILSTQ